MACAEKQIEFLTNLQRLLSEGSFVSTYKYALLLALADLCIELGHDDDAPLEIPTRRIGEKFAEYYWRQCAPYLPAGGDDTGVLRQNTGAPPRIITLFQELRRAHGDSLVNLRRNDKAWIQMVKEVTAQVCKMPLWKLQTIGSEKLDFLYASDGGNACITLKPGVSYCFRKHYPLVVDLAKGAWAQYIRRFNAHRLAEKTDLYEFLFGSERANLDVVRSIVREFQSGECFYCRRPLREELGEVDHFIPWSRYPVDLGHNFVLAHRTCNGQKSDRLPAVHHLAAWATQNRDICQAKSAAFGQKGISSDLATSVRIMEWAYGQTSEFHGLTWLRARELEPLPAHWRDCLVSLMN